MISKKIVSSIDSEICRFGGYDQLNTNANDNSAYCLKSDEEYACPMDILNAQMVTTAIIQNMQYIFVLFVKSPVVADGLILNV